MITNNANSKNYILLIVDDEETMRRFMIRVLKNEGYTVFGAYDGLNALEVAGKIDKIDMLITDVVMPRLGGLQLSHDLLLFQPKMKTLFVSGQYYNWLNESNVLTSQSNFLAKPFTSSALIEKVRSCLNISDIQSK